MFSLFRSNKLIFLSLGMYNKERKKEYKNKHIGKLNKLQLYKIKFYH